MLTLSFDTTQNEIQDIKNKFFFETVSLGSSGCELEYSHLGLLSTGITGIYYYTHSNGDKEFLQLGTSLQRHGGPACGHLILSPEEHGA